MKKIVSIAAVLLIITSCYAQKINLGLNLTKGQVYNQRMNAAMKIGQNINGMAMDINMSIIGSMSYKVTGIADSVYDLEVRYDSLAMKMSMPNGVMDFNSEKQDGNDIFSSLLAELKNKPFLVKMTKSGKVKEVKNIEEMFSGMFDKFPQLSDMQKQQLKSQLMQAYGERSFKGSIESASAIFPETPVAKGDKWTTNTTLESGFTANITSVYELKEIGDTYCIISGTASIATDNKGDYTEVNGMPMKYNMDGTMTSEIKVNRETGWVIESNITQSLKGSADVKDNPQVPGGMSIPMTIDIQTKIWE